MDKPLDVEVRDLLESRRGDWTRIAEGAGVSHSWISQFVRGKIPNPGFGTLTTLRDYLREQAAHTEGTQVAPDTPVATDA